jgi:hypothetical protein
MNLSALRSQMSSRQKRQHDQILQMYIDLRAELIDPAAAWTDGRLTSSRQSTSNPNRVLEE